jgi:adenine-specific DNA-methyltransferase
MAKSSDKSKKGKKVTRYTYEDVKEPLTPETGHTSLLPDEEQVVTLPMDNGWSKAIKMGRLSEDDERPVLVDMDPAVDPVLFWAGKRNKREIPLLPLQRNEVVSESRINQIIERAGKAAAEKEPQQTLPMFAELERSLREGEKNKRVEFYTHDEGWRNKLICGDSLHVMESLIHYENLRGQVQVVYIDPPYGIRYDSNFQQRVDSTKNDEKDRADDTLSVKAFRDTWSLGIHSYLSYLQERLYLCRELLANSGSVFLQISDENVHLVRNLLDEVFGRSNFLSQITFQKTGSQETHLLGTTVDYLLWYAKSKTSLLPHYRQLYKKRMIGDPSLDRYDQIEQEDGTIRALNKAERMGDGPIPDGKRFQLTSLISDGDTSSVQDFVFQGEVYRPKPGSHWKTTVEGLERLAERGRIVRAGKTLRYKRYVDDFEYVPIDDRWESMQIGRERDYVVQTAESVVERCILMNSKPGDLIFDPTCGSGTTAFCAERLGRRWITCDTSRVAVNVTRRRLLSAIFPAFKTRGSTVQSDFIYKKVSRIKLETLAKGLEPELVELVNQPEEDKNAIRVTGPFDVMTLGRYSVEDWKGYISESGKLENYIEVISRLYRKDASIQSANGLIHAIAESDQEKIAISVGPLSGRVTAKQILDAVEDALSSGITEVHVLGWSFEANVGEIKSKRESRGKVKIELVMIRPDTLVEGLKATKPETLFSPLALPDVDVSLMNGKGKPKEAIVTLKGVGVFDRKRRTTDYYHADSGYVAAWYLDEDYDGDCFVDCQMFFDFGKTPNLKAALKFEINPGEFKLQLTSQPFPIRRYKRIAVKVVDVYGNESTVVKDLA